MKICGAPRCVYRYDNKYLYIITGDNTSKEPQTNTTKTIKATVYY